MTAIATTNQLLLQFTVNLPTITIKTKTNNRVIKLPREIVYIITDRFITRQLPKCIIIKLPNTYHYYQEAIHLTFYIKSADNKL